MVFTGLVGGVFSTWAWIDRNYAAAVILTSALHTMLGCYVFMHHGGRRITASGTYFLASAIFVGMAGLGVAVYRPSSLDDALAMSVLATFLSNVAVYLLFARTVVRRSSTDHPPMVNRLSSVNKAGWLGVVMVLVGSGAQLAAPSLKALTMGIAYSGCVVTMLAFVERWRARSLIVSPRWLVISILAVAFFLAVFFSGGGRLNVATIGISAGLLTTNIRERDWYKRVFLLAAVPAVVLGGLLRAGGFNSRNVGFVPVVLEAGQGLGSVWDPVDTFAEIIRYRRLNPASVPLQHGATMWEALVGPIPRAWWPEKPEGLGLRLTRWFMPSYSAAGHSLAATAFGEWYLNFGWLGFPIGALIIGGTLSLLDRIWYRAVLRRGKNLRTLLAVALWTVLIAGIADYVWVGFFTYNVRAGIRAFVLLPLLALLYLLRPQRRFVAEEAPQITPAIPGRS